MPEINVERQFEDLRAYLERHRAEINIPKETDYFSLLVGKLLTDEVFSKKVQEKVIAGKKANGNFIELNDVLESAGIFVDADSILALAASEFAWASVSYVAKLFGNKNIGTFN